jgi:hypothetical protein
MQAISSAPIAQTVPVMQALRSLAVIPVVLCAGAFMLLTATAFSDYIVRLAAGETADWGQFFGQFAVPAVPMVLALVLLAARVRATASMVAIGGTLLYLLLWVTVAY